jgi:hypothetical protein
MESPVKKVAISLCRLDGMPIVDPYSTAHGYFITPLNLIGRISSLYRLLGEGVYREFWRKKTMLFSFLFQPFPVFRMGDGDESSRPLVTAFDKNLLFQEGSIAF